MFWVRAKLAKIRTTIDHEPCQTENVKKMFRAELHRIQDVIESKNARPINKMSEMSLEQLRCPENVKICQENVGHLDEMSENDKILILSLKKCRWPTWDVQKMSKKGQKNVGGPNEMSENVKTY